MYRAQSSISEFDTELSPISISKRSISKLLLGEWISKTNWSPRLMYERSISKINIWGQRDHYRARFLYELQRSLLLLSFSLLPSLSLLSSSFPWRYAIYAMIHVVALSLLLSLHCRLASILILIPELPPSLTPLLMSLCLAWSTLPRGWIKKYRTQIR